MKCVVINLADQSERWEAMAAQFSGAPLVATRFDAIRGIHLSQANRDALYSTQRNRREHHQPLTPGEVGCYASHLAVWRALLASADSHWAVFEDDVILHPELSAVLQAVDDLSPDWGQLKLIGRSNEKVAAAQDWIPGHQLIRYRRVPSWCSAYVIHRLGAEQMLGAHVPFGRPVDIDMRYWWESGCRIFGVLPYPVSLSAHSEESTIGRRSDYGRFAAKLRRFLLGWNYSFKNWQASRRDVPTRFPAPMSARPQASVGQSK